MFFKVQVIVYLIHKSFSHLSLEIYHFIFDCGFNGVNVITRQKRWNLPVLPFIILSLEQFKNFVY